MARPAGRTVFDPTGPDLAARLPPLDPDCPVLIAGPTASGKSALALAIAEAGGGVIVNADALQVFGCWRLLTARPGPEETARAPHLLYGHVGRADPYSVGHWLRDIAPILRGPARAIVVGGTGLFFRALTEGLAEIPAIPDEVRAEGAARLATGGTGALVADLDTKTANAIDLDNPARVRRAWEVWRATGRGLAAWQADTGPPLLPAGQAHTLLLQPDRTWLAGRIEARFDAMVAAGVLQEVRAALPEWDPALPSSHAIGAADLIAHLRGTCDLDTAMEAAKRGTRQYAKRQRTWFRSRMSHWHRVTTS